MRFSYLKLGLLNPDRCHKPVRFLKTLTTDGGTITKTYGISITNDGNSTMTDGISITNDNISTKNDGSSTTNDGSSTITDDIFIIKEDT